MSTARLHNDAKLRIARHAAGRRNWYRMCVSCLHGKHEACENTACPCCCNDIGFKQIRQQLQRERAV